MKIEIVQYPALNDNYNFLLRDKDSDLVAAIDPSDFQGTKNKLHEKGWRLDQIWNTHHHPDHIGGNQELKQEFRCQLRIPEYDQQRIKGNDIKNKDGDQFEFGSSQFEVLYLPGHTLGHIAYHCAEDQVLFIGDVIFAMGCGRVFEGTMEQMYSSIERVKSLDPDTLLYCAHEYTLANGRFAMSVEPQNSRLIDRMQKVNKLRQQGLPTVPTRLRDELNTNPFMRTDSMEIRMNLKMESASAEEVFAELRSRKDHF